MFQGKKIGVVVPAFNEERKIKATLKVMPDFIDNIYVIDDCSTDDTKKIVGQVKKFDQRIRCTTLKYNQGVGRAIASGYQMALKSGDEVVVVMAGDGQMSPGDLPAIIKPVANGLSDYSKGNRFLRGGLEIKKIPIQRFLGNVVLSILTKIISGYWHISDSQSGYTAINQRALRSINWDDCYSGYGCPNDILVRLNIANMRVVDVPIEAVYGKEWSSSMSSVKVVIPIIRLIWNLFWMRLFQKYVVKNSHPLVISYIFSFLGFFVAIILMLYIIFQIFTEGRIPQTASIIFSLSLVVSFQLLINAFSMDYVDNLNLCVQVQDSDEKL